VPLHSARLREREFNQADVLARLLARRAGAPVLAALRRIRYTTTQTRLDREERMQNLRNAFRVRQTSRVSGSHLILVDDVFTTGSTVEECARVLKRAGAASVRVVTVARG
jgi:ComF family protein